MNTGTTLALDTIHPPTTDPGRAEVRERGGRLVLRLWTQTYAQRQEVLQDLRATFPGHQGCIWRKATGAWSFPLRHRERLQDWLCCWFPLTAIDWQTQPTKEVV